MRFPAALQSVTAGNPGGILDALALHPHPRHAGVCCHAQAIRQLSGVVLDVADVDELMFELASVVI
jgi:hypothetical protein